MQLQHTKLIKTSDDTAKFEKQWSSQRYFDDNGMVMHGIYTRNYNRTIHKYYINNGYLMNRYIYPKIDHNFNHVMINDYNQHLCGGWFFVGIEDTECLTRVIQGLKPIGYFITRNHDEYEYWLEYCTKFELKYITSNNTENNRYEIGLSIDAKFGDIFNLDMLIMDYSKYAKAIFSTDLASEWIENITGFLTFISDKNISECLPFNYANPETYEDLILTGLTLGYPVENTVSIIWQQYR